MKKIILTGRNEEEFKEIVEKDEPLGCYFCKRKEGDEGVFLFDDERDMDIGTQKLDFLMVDVPVRNIVFKIPSCHECILIFKGFVEKFSEKLNYQEEKEVIWN